MCFEISSTRSDPGARAGALLLLQSTGLRSPRRGKVRPDADSRANADASSNPHAHAEASADAHAATASGGAG
jgi:hypothetical protein